MMQEPEKSLDLIWSLNFPNPVKFFIAGVTHRGRDSWIRE